MCKKNNNVFAPTHCAEKILIGNTSFCALSLHSIIIGRSSTIYMSNAFGTNSPVIGCTSPFFTLMSMNSCNYLDHVKGLPSFLYFSKHSATSLHLSKFTYVVAGIQFNSYLNLCLNPEKSPVHAALCTRINAVINYSCTPSILIIALYNCAFIYLYIFGNPFSFNIMSNSHFLSVKSFSPQFSLQFAIFPNLIDAISTAVEY